MAEPDEIDYLNDPLLVVPDEKPRAPLTPVLDRARESILRIAAFVEENGAEPLSEPGRNVHERMLANELAGLRASRGQLDGLEIDDARRLVFETSDDHDPLDDPLLDDTSGIFDVRDEVKPPVRPDYIADRKPCADFQRFEPLFAEVRRAVEKGERNPQPFRQERVDLGEFFVLKGQLVYVADLREEHRANKKADARLRVIFDNETESDLLMSSLVRRLYEDKDARRVGTTDAGPLFSGARTGLVYVLRSLSDRPETNGLYKVGTTAGEVEDRIAGAERQSSFLFAPVEIIETHELWGYSAKEAEQRVHRALQKYRMKLKVTGSDGRLHTATEWFRASLDTIRQAISMSV